MAEYRPPHRPRRTRRQRQMQALVVMAIALGSLTALVILFGVVTIADPILARSILSFRPTPTLFIMNPSDTPDPRPTMPSSWTPPPTPRPSATATLTRTPTQPPLPSATITPVPSPTYTPLPTIYPGWTEFVIKEARFAFQLPNTWSAVMLARRDANAAVDDITQNNPTLGASIRHGWGAVEPQNIILIAFDTVTIEDPYVVNLSVAAIKPVEEGTEIDTIDTLLERRLEVYDGDEGYELLATDGTTLDFRRAHRIRYKTSFESEVGRVTVYHLEVISETRRADHILILTLSTSGKRRNIYEGLLDQIVATVRYLRQ